MGGEEKLKMVSRVAVLLREGARLVLRKGGRNEQPETCRHLVSQHDQSQ
jgi:hypothetical protein